DSILDRQQLLPARAKQSERRGWLTYPLISCLAAGLAVAITVALDSGRSLNAGAQSEPTLSARLEPNQERDLNARGPLGAPAADPSRESALELANVAAPEPHRNAEEAIDAPPSRGTPRSRSAEQSAAEKAEIAGSGPALPTGPVRL